MSRKDRLWVSYDALSRAAAQDAADCDARGAFPDRAFEGLRALGILRNPPVDPAECKTLLRALAAIGRGSLSVGRIFEGHCNALVIIKQFATPEQRKDVDHLLAGGAIFGVWNTDSPQDPVKIADERLTGAKNFASGVDGVSHAIITVGMNGNRQMLLLPIADLSVDRSWWKPMGMTASGSHVVSFDGVAVAAAAWLGDADAYTREPWFSAGAIRFLAVQVGGMHAILDVVSAHLRAAKRGNNPHQLHRVGQMSVAVSTSYQWLEYLAGRWSCLGRAPDAEIIAAANAGRVAVEREALYVLELAERSVGASGMIAPHPLERLIRDLRTYLRQPNPDAALAAVGSAVLDDTWRPECDA